MTLLAMAATAGLTAAGCQPVREDRPSFDHASSKDPAPTSPATQPFERIPDAHLPNAHRVTDKVLSGGQPEGEPGFQKLHELGVKTIISVDGSKPDVANASKYGMRYVHLPIGYNGVSEAQGKAIAKAIHELPGPVYVHCHHGKHRSAAAVAVACVNNGMLPPERAESVLKTFGTGANYKGLWKAAGDAKPLGAQALRSLDVEFVETAKIAAMADAMVAVDHTWEHLKEVQQSGWKAPRDHPDLDPPHEALQLQEHFREMGRMESAKARPDDFRKLMLESEEGARALADALRARPVNAAAAEGAFNKVAASCTACHKGYRD